MANTVNIGLLTCTGTKQGAFKCSESKRVEGDLKYSDGCEGHAFTVGLTVPYDASRLVVSGRATLGAFTIWKPVDSCSPKFFQAAATGEVFTKWSYVINKINPSGKPTKFYQWDLTNAIIAKFTQAMGEEATDGDVGGTAHQLHDLERLDFIYETLTHTQLWQNTTATYSMVGAGGS